MIILFDLLLIILSLGNIASSALISTGCNLGGNNFECYLYTPLIITFAVTSVVTATLIIKNLHSKNKFFFKKIFLPTIIPTAVSSFILYDLILKGPVTEYLIDNVLYFLDDYFSGLGNEEHSIMIFSALLSISALLYVLWRRGPSKNYLLVSLFSLSIILPIIVLSFARFG